MKKKLKIIGFLLISLAFCLLAWKFTPYQPGKNIKVFRWDSAAGVMTVVVDVFDHEKQPVPDAEVLVDNNSGGSSALTNPQGRAIIQVGEPFVDGLKVGSREFDLRWRSLNAADRLRLVVYLPPE